MGRNIPEPNPSGATSAALSMGKRLFVDRSKVGHRLLSCEYNRMAFIKGDALNGIPSRICIYQKILYNYRNII